MRRALNTRLSSGTSAGTFACPAGHYKNCRGEAGTKNKPRWYFVPGQEKGAKVDPHVSNQKISLISFSRESGPPFKNINLSYLINISSKQREHVCFEHPKVSGVSFHRSLR